jgi:hypothetical protein
VFEGGVSERVNVGIPFMSGAKLAMNLTARLAEPRLSHRKAARRPRDARVAVDAELAVAEARDVVGHGGGGLTVFGAICKRSEAVEDGGENERM